MRCEGPKEQTSPFVSAPRQLRNMLESPKKLARLVGAHNALGAKLVEAHGFDGVWASGLEISAACAVPDASILTMTEMLAAAQPMAEAVSIPVVADCDTGFGSPANVARTVRKYEAAGIAAVCIEDALFPKRNSLLPGEHPLANMEEFVEKIVAAKGAQRGRDFVVIARVEALIAGCGQEEAMRRAEAYAAAGADAILIHSSSSSPDEIVAFAGDWRRDEPLVIVPTTYFALTEAEIRRLGNVRMVIYANHGLRAAITAMGRVLRQIRDDGTTANAVKWIAPVEDIFEIQGIVADRFDRLPGAAREPSPLRTGASITVPIGAPFPSLGTPGEGRGAGALPRAEDAPSLTPLTLPGSTEGGNQL